MGILTITIPACNGCCTSSPWLLVGECESLTGTATICGYSGFNDGTYDVLDPWAWSGQLRKWRNNSQTGSITHEVHDGAGVACAKPINPGFTTTTTYTGDESITCDATTGTPLSSPQVNDGANPTFFTNTVTLTTASIVGNELCLDENGDDVWDRGVGSASQELTEEQYFYDALEAELAGGGSVTTGTSCCTSTTSADLTSPESTSPISITGTAVRVPITVMNCSPVGALFTVYITLSQGMSTFVVDVGIQCLVATNVYIPMASPGDDPICFVSASLDP